MRIIGAGTAMLMALALAACGSSTRTTGTATTGAASTPSATGTVRINPDPSAGKYASQYPASFSTSFVSSCAKSSGGATTTCQCFLHYLEGNVPYTVTEASIGVMARGKNPSWYPGAKKACLG